MNGTQVHRQLDLRCPLLVRADVDVGREYQSEPSGRGRSDALITSYALPFPVSSGAPGQYGISSRREFGTGRVFYTALAHNESAWELPEFQQHLLGMVRAMRWSCRIA